MKRTEYDRARSKVDLSYRIERQERRRIRRVLTNSSAVDTRKMIKLLGCTRMDGRKHIESMFHDSPSGRKMTWESFGLHGWHLDHKRALSKFDLTDDSHRHIAFHYTNLQPMWADENYKKRDK